MFSVGGLAVLPCIKNRSPFYFAITILANKSNCNCKYCSFFSVSPTETVAKLLFSLGNCNSVTLTSNLPITGCFFFLLKLMIFCGGPWARAPVFPKVNPVLKNSKFLISNTSMGVQH